MNCKDRNIFFIQGDNYNEWNPSALWQEIELNKFIENGEVPHKFKNHFEYLIKKQGNKYIIINLTNFITREIVIDCNIYKHEGANKAQLMYEIQSKL